MSADSDDFFTEQNGPQHKPWWQWLLLAVCIALMMFSVLVAVGCNQTVIPRAVESKEASFDGNAQNSGVIAVRPDGYVVSASARARYNELVAIFGRDFKPAAVADGGITALPDGTFLMNRQTVVQWVEMSKWRRAGFNPTNP